MAAWKRFLARLFRRETSLPTSYARLVIGMSKISAIIEEYSDSTGNEYAFGHGALKIFNEAQIKKALTNPYAAFVVDQELRIEARTMAALNENNKLSEEILKQTAKNDEIRMKLRGDKGKLND